METTSDAPPSPVDFSTFVLGLASNALVQLGVAPDPETGTTTSNLVLARQSIDILGVLHEKTRGNLDDSERRLLEAMLYDLRLKFVETRKAAGE
jgi:hypothetical protein